MIYHPTLRGKQKKGQMFIVTVVFLVGVVFVVQQILLQYSYLDLPSSYQHGDFHLMRSAEIITTRAVTVAGTCTEAEENLKTSLLFLAEQTAGGYSLDVDYSVNCTNWDNKFPEPGPVTANIRITSESSETTNTMVVYSKGAHACACNDWVDLGCSTNFGCSVNEMRKTRVCTPSFCELESMCVLDLPNCP